MQFIKSLWCSKGCDNQTRFLAIHIALYLCFTLLNALAPSELTFNFVLLAVTTTLSALSVKRRLYDARLVKNLIPIVTGAFVLTSVCIIFISSTWVYWLLLIPSGLVALLYSYTSKSGVNYVLGYNGPVNLNLYKNTSTNAKVRIEPSLQGVISDELISTLQLSSNTCQADDSNQYQSRNDQFFIPKQIAEFIFKKKNISLIIVTLATLIIGFSAVIILSEDNSLAVEDHDSHTVSTRTIKDNNNAQLRLHAIEFPDGFTLMINKHSGVYVNWQADEIDKKQLWSQDTALGDKSCSVITFNNKVNIRTLNVNVENGENYYALFSPLDTKLLLKNLAARSHFKLCGYKFSLNGSQAILGKNSPYAEYLNYN